MRPTPAELSSSTTSESNHTHSSSLRRSYSTSGSTEANLAIVVVLLLSALVCALALNCAIRFFLHGCNIPFNSSRSNSPRRRQPQKTSCPEVDSAHDVVKAAATPMAFSSAGTEVECAICLSEFVEGEEIQVLKSCKHSFHLQCIQKWLHSKSSCPTCRCSLKAP